MPYNSDGSFTLPTGSTNATPGVTIASATWDSILNDIQTALGHIQGNRVYTLRGVNFNPGGATDVAISISIPTTGLYRIGELEIANATATLSGGSVGLFTATGGGGTTIIGSTALSVTSSLAGHANSLQVLSSSIANTTAWNNSTIQFRITTPVGTAATADVMLYVNTL